MIRTATALAVLALAVSAFAQGAPNSNPQQSAPSTAPVERTVSVSAKGEDVRSILHDLFKQVNRNFVLQPGIQHALFLNLEGVSFDEALEIIAKTASLQFEVQNDIYYITRTGNRSTQVASQPTRPNPTPTVAANVEPRPAPTRTAPSANRSAPPVTGRLNESLLTKVVTTRLSKTDIRVVFAHLSVQTNIAIEVDPNIPAYKVDAFLIRTSLKFALDEITKAAGLQYRFTSNQSILITTEPTARVTVSGRDR